MLAFLLIGAAAATALQPTSKWQVNFDEGQCLAQRQYGTTDKPLTLALKGPASGDVMQLAVLGGKGGPANAEQDDGSIAWGAAKARPTSVLNFRTTGSARRVYLINLPRTEVVEAAGPSSNRLAVSLGRGVHYDFAVTGLPGVMKVMDECVADLRQYWNYSDVEVVPGTRLRSKASADLSHLFSSFDYPRDALRRGQSGMVGVVLLIAADGKVADCTLTQTSGIAALDSQTCAIIQQRGRYKPAVGLDGKPARDTDHARIRWKVH